MAVPVLHSSFDIWICNFEQGKLNLLLLYLRIVIMILSIFLIDVAFSVTGYCFLEIFVEDKAVTEGYKVVLGKDPHSAPAGENPA